MTELYIDGIAAVLPRDFSIQVKRENPLFTKNGEYTYDITLQLSNPTNAALYSHLNRLNTTGWPTEKRKAILIADNRVYCNGTEVITAWTDDSVSIQVASGNSELNYIAGGGTTLGELDMIQTTPTAGTWQEHVEKTFPEVEWCLPVVVDEEGGEVCNAVRFDFYPVFPVTVTRPVEGATLRPQPFLCAFIRSLFTALGYRLVHNSLEDTEFRLLYMLNTKSDDWAEMFAGWKVVDFLDAVEKLFNGTFVIDNKLKEARFLFNTAYYAGTETIHVAAVSDVYEAEVEDESDALDYARARVSYPGGGSYWKMQCLDDGYLEQARLIDIPADFAPEEIVSNVPSELLRARNFYEQYDGQLTGRELFRDVRTGRCYLFAQPGEDDALTTVKVAVLDSFAPLNRESEEQEELDMAPAQTELVGLQVKVSEQPGLNPTMYFQAAVADGAEDGTAAEQPQDELEVIKEWTDDSPSAETIRLAFYNGMAEESIAYRHDNATYTIRCRYPQSATDTMTLPGQMHHYNRLRATGLSASLRLSFLQEQFYRRGYEIDYTKAVKVSSHDPNLYPANRIFEIRNRRYVCREMEFTLSPEGREGEWTGIFYPIRISDTEADARWILADGKWRDGGVWLDNGRWLDE